MIDEFTRAYRKCEEQRCDTCGVCYPFHADSCSYPIHKPFPAEWAASHRESVADAVNRQSTASKALETGLYIVGGVAVWVLRKLRVIR